MRMYGQTSDLAPLDWSWVSEQLGRSGTYWVVPRSDEHPHPRPVWGVWLDLTLRLSIGSPVLARSMVADPVVTVHLDSGTDVVILEGQMVGTNRSLEAVAAYDVKYDWSYDIDEYGPFTAVAPETVIAWRSAGWAGRDGFQQGGRWTFDSGDDSS